MTTHVFLLILLLLFAITAVMAQNILFAALSLAAASLALTLLLFNMSAPWAAVFELSVCAGLITVLFISTITLVRKHEVFMKEGRSRFAVLPGVACMAAAILWYFSRRLSYVFSNPRLFYERESVGSIMWELRTTDIIGQLCLFVAGVLVVTAFFHVGRKTKQ